MIRKGLLQKSDLSSLTKVADGTGGVGVCVKEGRAFHGWAGAGGAEWD